MPDPRPSDPHSPDVDYQVHQAVAEIGLNHRPANALSEAMIGRVVAALDRARADPQVRAVIVHSRVPGVFCAGIDLKRLVGAEPEQLRGLLDQLYTGLTEAQHRLGKPTIAAIAGAARGGGMTLAISCDLIVAGRSASFGYPEIELGVLPAIHFTHLPRIVGRYRAFDLLFTGRSFDTAEAQALGLVSRVVDDGARADHADPADAANPANPADPADLASRPAHRVLHEARALAQVLAAKAPGAMRLGHAAFHQATDHGYRQGVAGAVETFCGSAVAAEGREGLAAFAAKRAPSWRQR